MAILSTFKVLTNTVTDGSCGAQRAPLENRDKSTYDPIYRRTSSSKTRAVSSPSDSRVTWILHSVVDNSQLSTVEISWLTSKVEEIFNAAEIIAKMEELVDIPQLHLLSSQNSVYDSEIVHIESNLKELSNETLECELREQKILREEERLRKMREDLMD
ncbi:hypothetical protein Cgig2_001782 [Carnegiea gigantea]|uniref:Uncharacterized protein n=1 Tax=Carnegiea gigantea TaxID=171969 RepID=A0A9Q1KGY9_9CARY|nr:hypothetical protein Cgig2_001782 [Carnegiea gigantea]